MEKIKKFFDLDGRKTSFSVELIAGITTFMTLVSGIVFVLLTIFGIRDVIARMMPKNIKIAIGTAIGFLLLI